MSNSFHALATIQAGARPYRVYRLDALTRQGISLERLPFSLKVLLENLLRHEDGATVTADDVLGLARWGPKAVPDREIAFRPARVLLQDFTGVPAVVDLAAMREAMRRLGGDPTRINPLQPVELVIDHSVQVDFAGAADALLQNTRLEYERNRERYMFLRWGQGAFQDFRVVPPETGIVHQVNLEYLARVVFESSAGDGPPLAYPDTLVGTDSHTTMINGLGVLGWGVGGIEAEAAMLGQPVSMLVPQVVGFKLTGHLPEGATATDLVLTVTQMLRKKGVVGKFVEFFGPGLGQLPLADRATIANMAPEYGATCGIFPIDDETLRYMELSGRPKDLIALVEAYAKEQGLFRTASTPDPEYSDTLALDLASVEPSLAGPKRPQDRVPLRESKASWAAALKGMGKTGAAPNGHLTHGSVVIAAITSCTNTSNPSVMVAAGLLAKKAVEKGLTTKPWVKASHPALHLLSAGKTMDIYKDIGHPSTVAERYGFSALTGTHLVGHTRMATESAVTPDRAHPFTAGEDFCLVHNGTISNPFMIRRRLEHHGIVFDTDNDTEAACRYLEWRMQEGDDLETALTRGFEELDGFYTFLIGTGDKLALVRDAFACKPAVVAETDDYVAIASEFRALAHLPGVDNARLFEPMPEELYVWKV